jgi:hypothetical protein
MQPQSKSVCRAGLAAIAAPDPGTVGMARRITRVRTIRVWPTIREWDDDSVCKTEIARL